MERTFEGITGVAVPIRDFRGKVVASVGVCFISSSVETRELKGIIKEALKTALDISREIGYLEKKAGSYEGMCGPAERIFIGPSSLFCLTGSEKMMIGFIQRT